MIPRRAFLAGLGALVAAPAVIRTPGLLMPVRRIIVPPVLRLHEAVRAILGGSDEFIRSIEAHQNTPGHPKHFIIASQAQSDALAAHRMAGLPMWVEVP